MNREQRRKLEKMEKKANKTILSVPEPTEKSKGWVAYMKEWGIDMDKWLISFSGWLHLSKNEKSAAILQMIDEDMVHPDKDSEKSVESGWKKVEEENKDAGREDSEAEETSEGQGD